jgi:hypothetical protein
VVVDGSKIGTPPIEGAVVTVLGPGTFSTTITTLADGKFSVDPAPNGLYRILAGATGYQNVAEANPDVNCSLTEVKLTLTPNEQQQPTPTPTSTSTPMPTQTPTTRPTDPPGNDPTPTPLPPAPTATPPLPPTLPNTGDGPPSNPAGLEWLVLALVALVCGVVGWRGGGVRSHLP